MTAFLDTNVLVYAFDGADQRKRDIAIAILEGDLRFVVSAQVLSEFYVTVTRKLTTPLPEQDAAATVERLSRLSVVSTDSALIQAAVDTSRTHRIPYWDALIVEAAALAGCDRLLTEDLADGAVLRGVRIANPFA